MHEQLPHRAKFKGSGRTFFNLDDDLSDDRIEEIMTALREQTEKRRAALAHSEDKEVKE